MEKYLGIWGIYTAIFMLIFGVSARMSGEMLFLFSQLIIPLPFLIFFIIGNFRDKLHRVRYACLSTFVPFLAFFLYANINLNISKDIRFLFLVIIFLSGIGIAEYKKNQNTSS